MDKKELLVKNLSKTDRHLIALAGKVRRNAYAPYSSFKVGAAIQAGAYFFSGCNVENTSSPNGCCAEKSAIVNMVSQGITTWNTIVIFGDSKPTYPCGGCLQVLSEFSGTGGGRVLLVGEGVVFELKFQDLYPNPFKERK